LAFGRSIRTGQAIPVTITLRSPLGVTGVRVGFKVQGPDPSLDRDDPSQTVDLQPDQPLQISKSVVFPVAGRYWVLATMYLPAGKALADSATVELTETGGVVNPPSPLGTPAPARPPGVPSRGVTPTPFPSSAVPAGAVEDAVAGTVTLKGFVEYQARDNNTYRARDLKIEVMDLVGPDPSSDRLLGVTTTDADGN
jgi:hypothetical protein